MSKTVVAIVGRKNVGKSTLINRITGKRISIVEDLPGTTRDRILVDATWQKKEFSLIDTGGIEFDLSNGINREINRQINAAVAEADIIIFLTDVRDGLLPDDIELANRLRQIDKPILLVVNKADNALQDTLIADFFRLGIGDPMPISAYHGRGVGDLMDKIVSLIPASVSVEEAAEFIKVAIVGKPNVGKSTLLNALIGEERVIVDHVPGTTRDAIDTAIDFEGQNMLLIDTAGIKRQGKIETGVERYSVIRSRKAIERADIALLVFDASQEVSAQDTHVAGYIQEELKGIILVANKCDLIKSSKDVEYDKRVRQKFKFVPYAPLLFISAKTGQGINEIMPTILGVYKERMKRLPTNLVNNLIREAVATHNVPQKAGKHLNVLYATQAETNPPTFVFSVNDPTLVHFSYKRYLENKIRQSYGFAGTPIKLTFKPRSKS